ALAVCRSSRSCWLADGRWCLEAGACRTRAHGAQACGAAEGMMACDIGGARLGWSSGARTHLCGAVRSDFPADAGSGGGKKTWAVRSSRRGGVCDAAVNLVRRRKANLLRWLELELELLRCVRGPEIVGFGSLLKASGEDDPGRTAEKAYSGQELLFFLICLASERATVSRKLSENSINHASLHSYERALGPVKKAGLYEVRGRGESNSRPKLKPKPKPKPKICKAKAKTFHDKYIHRNFFQVHDKVWLFNSRLCLFLRKFTSRWDGPYTVVKACNNGAVIILDPKTGQSFT
ncbi:hypothetical protein Taro_050311, partial [Colocasia esculenta]|nr:hypothetical protein [Colocasia esculenta]